MQFRKKKKITDKKNGVSAIKRNLWTLYYIINYYNLCNRGIYVLFGTIEFWDVIQIECRIVMYFSFYIKYKEIFFSTILSLA